MDNNNITIDIDDKPHDKPQPNNDKPHNGKPIIKLEVSPNGKYLVTYSEEDNSVVGWNVEDVDEKPKSEMEYPSSETDEHIDKGRLKFEQIDKGILKPDSNLQPAEIKDKKINKMSVSDNKILAYTYKYKGRNSLKIIDMKNENQEIKLSGIIDMKNNRDLYSYYCTFNFKNEFVLYARVYEKISENSKNVDDYIWICSTQTKNNQWMCEGMYKMPKHFRGFEVINISKYDDKLYLSSINIIYECDIHAEEKVTKRIFANKNEVDAADIKITSNEKFICLRIKDKIIVYSIELEIPITCLDVNNDNFMHPGLYPLLPSLSSLFDMDYWNECLNHFKNNAEPVIQTSTTKCTFGILDGYVWKIKFDEKILKNIMKINFSFRNPDEIAENWYFQNSDSKKTRDLNIHLFNPVNHKELMEFINKTPQSKPEDDNDDDKCIYIEVPKNTLMDDKHEVDENDNQVIYIKVPSNAPKGNKYDDKHKVKRFIHVKVPIEALMVDALIIRDLIKKDVIQEFKKDDFSDKWNLIRTKIRKYNGESLLGIKLLNTNDIVVLTNMGLFIYYFNENDKSVSLNYYYRVIEEFKKKSNDTDTLPLPDRDSFKFDGWVSRLKDDKPSFLKYGAELLTFAIEEHELDLIEDIYKKCLFYFKEDLSNNRMFLSIITSAMPSLNNYYPEYIKRYSLETNMIIDSPYYSINRCHNNYICHNNYMQLQPNIHLTYLTDSKQIPEPTITFMIPYIKFNNYPQRYHWFQDWIMPQHSIFTKTIFDETVNSDIYRTWNGEALIGFKWKTYGKRYYILNWFIHYILLICFFIVASPPRFLNKDQVLTEKEVYIKNSSEHLNRTALLIASIILGFINLSFEVHYQLYCFYNKNVDQIVNLLLKPWELFDMIVYLLPIYTSINWLLTNNRNDPLLSFSCLFMFLKLLLCIRFFIYNRYLAIIINVGRRVFLFLMYFMIIMIFSFTFAFYVLLSPKLPYSLNEHTINDDPNNPWNLNQTYQVLENGKINDNYSIFQPPDENTNMFADINNAFFAVFLFFIGDISAFSNRPYEKNPALATLMAIFTSLIVIYLLNVFIGLFSEAIQNDDDLKALELAAKAELLAKIELFYLLPSQRRKKTWFPDVIYYNVGIEDIRKEIKKLIKNKNMDEDYGWNTDEFPEMKQDLLNKLNIKSEA